LSKVITVLLRSSQSLVTGVLPLNQSNCVQICLSLITVPFVCGLLVVESLERELLELGQASEEVFRGDRLPILNFPEPSSNPEIS
jgi:hypothetical protein